MIPGFGRGMNPHKMKRMMKQMGIDIQELEDVQEIIIRTSDKEYFFNEDVAVTIMKAQGQNTYQITGNPSIRKRSSEEQKSETAPQDVPHEEIKEESDEPVGIPHEDIELVCQQTGASEEEAKAALESCGGNPAEAILKLMEN